MGLGKTVEIIACILSHPFSPRPNELAPARTATEKIGKERACNESGCFAEDGGGGGDSEEIACVCGESEPPRASRRRRRRTSHNGERRSTAAPRPRRAQSVSARGGRVKRCRIDARTGGAGRAAAEFEVDIASDGASPRGDCSGRSARSRDGDGSESGDSSGEGRGGGEDDGGGTGRGEDDEEGMGADSLHPSDGLWVACDRCGVWQHAVCVGYPPSTSRAHLCLPCACLRDADSDSDANGDGGGGGERGAGVGAGCEDENEGGDVKVTAGVAAGAPADQRQRTRVPLLRSRATLIICPLPILDQWRSELLAHVRPGVLRVAVRRSVARLVAASLLVDRSVSRSLSIYRPAC
jgi:hypothetical protein